MTTEQHAQALAAAAQTAGLAPSVHNTQPWRWRVAPDRLDLYADRSRQLGTADPEGRLLMISCGTALHHARVALAAEGWHPVVEVFPVAGDPDHAARIRLDAPAGASAQGSAQGSAQDSAQGSAQDLAGAMRQLQAARNRRTDRRPLTGSPVPAETIALLRTVVEVEHSYLHVLRDDQVGELAAAAARADSLEAVDEPRRAELAYWVGGSRPAGTGLPDTAIPVHPPPTHVPARDFGASGTLPAGEGSDRAATYAVLFGDQDTPAGWLRAGEALSAVWLAATEHGVAVLPFSAPVEAAATRLVLRRLLSGLGHPYLVLRFGLPDPDHPGPPHTPRLDPDQTVEIVTD